jgi:hypothetical protein
MVCIGAQVNHLGRHGAWLQEEEEEEEEEEARSMICTSVKKIIGKNFHVMPASLMFSKMTVTPDQSHTSLEVFWQILRCAILSRRTRHHHNNRQQQQEQP